MVSLIFYETPCSSMAVMFNWIHSRPYVVLYLGPLVLWSVSTEKVYDSYDYTGRNRGKISGKCCIFPEIFSFFSQNERIIRPFWEKKWENFGRNTKFSRNFSMIFPSVCKMKTWSISRLAFLLYAILYVYLTGLSLDYGKNWEMQHTNMNIRTTWLKFP